jgi:superfamily II DNA or RNA helicase
MATLQRVGDTPKKGTRKQHKNTEGACPYLHRRRANGECLPLTLTQLDYDNETKTRKMPGDLKVLLDNEYPGLFEREYENKIDPRYNEKARIFIEPAKGKVDVTVKHKPKEPKQQMKRTRRRIFIRHSSPVVVNSPEINNNREPEEKGEPNREPGEPNEEPGEPNEPNEEPGESNGEPGESNGEPGEPNKEPRESEEPREPNREPVDNENLNDFYDDPEYDFLYPHLDDPNFSAKLTKRKEFNDTQYDGIIKDIQEQAEKLCDADFELMPHQHFVKNFMSFQTPYNSLLLYHGLGTGKTCSAIGIAEDTRNYMKQLGLKKSIMIVASPNVQDNFRLQLFDERKLEFANGVWDIQSCIGNSLLKEINPTDIKGSLGDRERIVSQIKTIIRGYYVFMGYTQFANYISEIIEIKGSVEYTDDERKKIKQSRIRSVFNNRLIIIDEVHNIRITTENKNRKAAELLMEVARHANNLRLLLLSATPMYNSHEEIVWLVNLMNLNDKRGTVRISDIFEKTGVFTRGGAELLKRKLNGYVSYVRGENPYTFPYRIYPEKDSSFVYPSKQMNGKTIVTGIQHVPVFMNTIGAYQLAGYNMILENMRNIGDDTAFEDKNSFGYAMLQKPLEALNIVYPSDDFVPGSGLTEITGKNGLSNIMKYKKARADKQYNFEYKPDVLVKYKRVFSPAELPKYSAKIAKICSMVQEADGIVLVYTQYIDGGAVPIALALEEIGFSRFGSDANSKSLFSAPPVPPSGLKYVMITGDASYSPNNDEDIKYLNSIENKEGANVKVVIISRAAGEGIDFKNIRQIHILEPWYNMNRIEQIIGRGVRNLSHCKLPFAKRNVEIFLHATMLGQDEESADLYVYRLAEQKSVDIGRVSRILKQSAVDCWLNVGQTNFTTEELMKVVANQTIELSLSSARGTIPYAIGDKPFTDVCDYMSSCAFTCNKGDDEIAIRLRGLFRIKNSYTREEIVAEIEEPEETIDSALAQIGENKHEYIVDANGHLGNMAKHEDGYRFVPIDVSTDTYGREFVESSNGQITYRIRELFKYRHFYNRDELVTLVNEVKEYPIEQIYSALTQIIENKNEYIVDMYGRIGNLVNHSDDYLFQPVEITDVAASIYERSVPVDVKLRTAHIESTSKVAEDVQTREDYMANIVGEFKEAFETHKATTSWYGTLASLTEHFKTEHKIDVNQLKKHVICHILDTSTMPVKLALLGNVCGDGACAVSPNKEIETLVQNYFKERLITSGNGTTGIALSPDNKSMRIFAFNGSEWTEAPFVESNSILKSKQYKQIYEIDDKDTRISGIIGFVSWFDSTRTREYVFKMRTLDESTVNKIGARVIQAQSKDIIKNINKVLGEPKYNIQNIKTYDLETKNKLAVLFEVLIREANDQKKDGKIWYLDNEQVISNGITSYTR